MDRRVYLDHNATSPLRPEAAEAIVRALAVPAAHPLSQHGEGRAARAILERAREAVAGLAGASPSEVVFTSGGLEAIAAAVHGVVARAPAPRRRLLIPPTEHSAVLDAARASERVGYTVVSCPVLDDGRVDVGAWPDLLGTEGTALAALQAANNETGVVQPVSEGGRVCARAGAAFLVDAVQAAGKIPLDFRGWGAHLLALAAHKLGGPQGIGALVVRDGIELAPLLGGPGEGRRRGGTPAVALAAGFGAAAEVARLRLAAEAARLTPLRARLEARLRAAVPGLVVHGELAARLPNTLSVGLPDIPGEGLVVALDLAGFAVSTGSACASGAVLPSHVLRAMGRSEEEARNALRISMGWSTTREDIDAFTAAFPEIAARVRAAAAEASA